MSMCGQPQCFSINAQCDMVSAFNALSTLNENEWENKRYRFPKLRYYNMYKATFSVEDYVKCNMPKWHRSVLAQFRAGILPLEIEIGRYTNTEIQNRLCKFCLLNDIEDEIHLLLQCTYYNDFRNDLYTLAYETYPEFYTLDLIDKFVFLLANMQRQVANFLIRAVQKRRDFLYINPRLNNSFPN